MNRYCFIPPIVAYYGCAPCNSCHGPVGTSYQYNRYATKGISHHAPALSSQKFYTLWRILNEVNFTTDVPRDVQLLSNFPIELRRLIFGYYARSAREQYLERSRRPEYSVGDYITEKGQPPLVNEGIDLSGKGLTSLDGLELFHHPEKVIELDLARNYISSYYATALDPYVQYVTDSPSPFRRFTNLRFLNLLYNELSELSGSVFAGLPLQSFDLSHNHLVKLQEGVFAGLERLERLDISHNRLRELKERVFAELINLRELKLRNNQLSVLREGVFAGLIKLRDLDLRDNQLRDVSEKVFADLENLQELYLWNNQLRELPEGVFSGLRNLVYLNVGDNYISGTEQEFRNRHRLLTKSKLTIRFTPQK